jgi:tetratricopeptide (TPR) repeat protein
MMMDDLINVLSRVPQIRVISRQTAHSYEGKSIDIAAIGAELQVRYVLEGSMRIQNGKLRVNFELVDPSTQLPVYSGRIDRDGADRQAVQDEIVGRLARELQVEIFPLESARHAGDKNADVLSYRGWSALHAAIAHIDLEQYNAAKALFEQALALEPGHIAAKLGLGVYHSNLGVQRLDPQTADHLEKGLSILREIVSRDPTNGVAYYHLGVALQGTTKLAEGLDALEQAIRLNPSNAGAHAHVGHVLARLARPDEGIQHIHYAMRLSPKDPAMSIWLEFAGAAELEREHYAEAIENFRRSAELSPNYPRPWAGLAAAYALEGKLDEAQRPMGRLKALSPNLSADELFIRFGRRGAPRLKDGLRLALASS